MNNCAKGNVLALYDNKHTHEDNYLDEIELANMAEVRFFFFIVIYLFHEMYQQGTDWISFFSKSDQC